MRRRRVETSELRETEVRSLWEEKKSSRLRDCEEGENIGRCGEGKHDPEYVPGGGEKDERRSVRLRRRGAIDQAERTRNDSPPSTGSSESSYDGSKDGLER